MSESEAVATLEKWLAALKEIHGDVRQIKLAVNGGEDG